MAQAAGGLHGVAAASVGPGQFFPRSVFIINVSAFKHFASKLRPSSHYSYVIVVLVEVCLVFGSGVDLFGEF